MKEKTENYKVTDKYGNIRWYNKDGQLHREGDKPAYIEANGDKGYYINGLLHREGDKPAYIEANGNKSYYLNGVFIKTNFIMKI